MKFLQRTQHLELSQNVGNMCIIENYNIWSIASRSYDLIEIVKINWKYV